MRPLPARPALALALVFALPLPALAADAVLAQAQQLLDQGQPQAAYDLLLPQLEAHAGEPDYDYLLGRAALDSGHPGQAAFAFERCLAVDPRHGPCRVLMARTHLALGETGSARAELETVQRSAPPPAVQALVQQYLGLAARQAAAERQRVQAYAQVGLGHDSNVTSTTADTQIALPALGGVPFTLSGLSTKQEDGFAQAEAGASLSRTLGPAWTLLADATLNGRRYQDVDRFDTQTAGLGAGLAWRQGSESVLGRVMVQDYRLDDHAFRSLYGALLQYQHTPDERSALSAYVQHSHLDYHLTTPDAERLTLGGGYSRALAQPLAPVFYTGLYLGREDSAGPDFLSQDFYGLRLGGSLQLQAALRLTGGLSVERREFGAPDPLFLATRRDTAVDLTLGALYQLAAHLSLRPAYTYTRNDSTLVLSDYDRHAVSLDLRYDL